MNHDETIARAKFQVVFGLVVILLTVGGGLLAPAEPLSVNYSYGQEKSMGMVER